MENIFGFIILLSIIFVFMLIIGKVFESDLKELEKTNPKYRQYLKDNYDI